MTVRHLRVLTAEVDFTSPVYH